MAKRPYQFSTGGYIDLGYVRGHADKVQAIYGGWFGSRRSFASAKARDAALATFLDTNPNPVNPNGKSRVYITWESDDNLTGSRYFLFDGTELDIHGYPLQNS